MKLISMTDFVENLRDEMTLKAPLNFKQTKKYFDKVFYYSDFLKQPLKLEMFVPCDDDGNILEEPNDYFEDGEESIYSKKYNESLNKILFFDFEIIDNEEDFIEIHFSKGNIWISIQDNSGMVLTDGYKVEFPIKRIEDLIYYNILLTPNATKRIFG